MFIQTEDTPNPNTMKFIPGVPVLEIGTADFCDKLQAKKSNLASLIFTIDDVKRVFFSTDFISVSKSDESNWEVLKPLILTKAKGSDEIIRKSSTNLIYL